MCNKPCTAYQATADLSGAGLGNGTLSLHSGESTISFPVTSTQAEDISAAIQAVLTVFAEKQKAERPKRYKSMEYKHKGAACLHSLLMEKLDVN